MKRITLLAIMVNLFVAPAVIAVADDKSDIAAVFNKLNSATKSRNADAIVALLTPDYKEVGLNHKELQGAQAVQAVRAKIAELKSVSEAKVKPGDARITGNGAFMWADYSISAEILDKEGKYGAKGQKHSFADTGKRRYWLLKTPGGWKIQKAESLKEDPRVDGQSTRRMGPPRRG